jgi:hypothetical protein
MKRFAAILFSSALLVSFAACKKDEKKGEGAPADDTAVPAEGAKPAEQPAAAGGDIEARGVEVMTKMADIMDANKGDCDKMGAELSSFLDAQQGTMNEMKEFGDKQTDEQKQAFEAKYATQMEEAMGKMGPAIEACQDNAAVQAAMSKMPD